MCQSEASCVCGVLYYAMAIDDNLFHDQNEKTILLSHIMLILVIQSGRARVMAHNPFQSMLVISKPSTSSLVSAYGLAKVSEHLSL